MSAPQDSLGVSVYHLESVFMKDAVCSSKDTKGILLARVSKIYDIENLEGPPGVIRKNSASTICPLDGNQGAAYVHCIEGEDHVGDATHMLSYSWNYSIGDIVDTLTDFCLQNKLNPKRTYIWICCLCVNQHRVVENSALPRSGMLVQNQVDFFPILGERVQTIGHLLAMMAPWNAPVNLTRIWCIFEIFTACTTDRCKVDIVMSPKEKQSFAQDVINNGKGINALYELLGNTRVENAKASVESDRLAILRKVESGVGYQKLNNKVNDLLRGWMQGVLTQLVENRENTNNVDYVIFCNRIGMILSENGEHEAAMKLHKCALEICDTVFGEQHEETAATYNNIGLVLLARGDYEGALSKYKEALSIEVFVLGKDHPKVANTYNNIGSVLQDMGNYKGALSMFRKALLNQQQSGLDRNQCPRLATTYSNIGSVLEDLGDYAGALSKYNQALAIQVAVLGTNHPKTASIYNIIGSVLDEMGDYEGALARHKEALAIRLQVLGTKHPDTADSYNNYGLALQEIGDYEGALSMYLAAQTINVHVFGKVHPCVATTYSNIGSVLDDMGDYEGALSRYQEALAIRESALGKNHPSVATIYNNIGALLYAKGEYEEALLKFKECLPIWEPVLGLNHPYTQTCLKWIVTVKTALETTAHDQRSW
ncbi:Kinesin light chain [Seminavis robusta]|uniref:Kinesin light chain n=1 Tax=Seminavis robusta TaxID=568900 RepID=A0A9N8DDY4_9STRA|nr:Kinesin light chain [Seminavis robusta]|eukprot:Sro98_g050310.1 Kinesin light chain (655) ;mRNA; f:18649-20613